MMVCFVVLRASRRGGLVGRRDFGVLALFGVWVGGRFDLAGVEVAGVVVVVGCLPRRRQVMGIKAEVADAYEMGALEGAWRAGKSSGDEEGGLGRVSMGGALVNLTVFAGGADRGCVGVIGVFFEKYLKNVSWVSSKPSAGLKLFTVQNSLYVVEKVLKAAQPSGVERFGFEPIRHSKM